MLVDMRLEPCVVRLCLRCASERLSEVAVTSRYRWLGGGGGGSAVVQFLHIRPPPAAADSCSSAGHIWSAARAGPPGMTT